MSETTITHDQAKDLILNSNGGFFTVKFIKRKTGESRTLNCTRNYKHLLAGGQAKYDASAKNLIVVLEASARKTGKQYMKSIPVDGITDLRINGARYLVR